MKTQLSSALALLSIVFTFVACQKDGIVDMDLLSNNSERIESPGPDLDLRLSTPNPSPHHSTVFEILQSVKLQRPDCASGSSLEREDEAEPSNAPGCYGKYGLTGNDGRGWAEEFGNFTSVVDLEYNPMRKEINGTIELRIDSERTTIVLEALGSIARSNMPSGGTMYAVNVRDKKATGNPALIDFRGKVYIMHADQVFNNKLTYSEATIMLRGAFGAEVRASD